ncbi:MAG: hypothetical protein V4616_07920 [Bacteroidota bacterium]
MKQLLGLIALVLTLSNAHAQDDLSSDTSNRPARGGYILSYGIGTSLTGSFEDNNHYDDYYFFSNGLSNHAKLEAFYNLSKSPDKNLWISSGVNWCSYSANGMKDAFTDYFYQATTLQVPLNVSLVANLNEGRISMISTVGVFGRFFMDKSYLVKRDLSTNTISRQTLDGESFGITFRAGVKIRLTGDLFYMSSVNFETDLTSNSIRNGSATLTNGIGVNF